MGMNGLSDDVRTKLISGLEESIEKERKAKEACEAPLNVEAQKARLDLESNSEDWFFGIDMLQPRSGKQWKGRTDFPHNEKPMVYKVSAEASSTLFGTTLYEPVHDNTEAIAGVADLKIPPNTNLLVDVGGGDHDAVKNWLETNRGVQEALVLDPFTRSVDHNQKVQKRILEKGGADVVTSISVLNVIPEVSNRMRHLVLVHHILKEGGVAFFKVWAGMWPDRGLGKPSYDSARGVWQENKW